MPKKRDVASLVGNFSPVKRRRAILVSNLRHRSGDIGDELKSRAAIASAQAFHGSGWEFTFLENRCPIDF